MGGIEGMSREKGLQNLTIIGKFKEFNFIGSFQKKKKKPKSKVSILEVIACAWHSKI